MQIPLPSGLYNGSKKLSILSSLIMMGFLLFLGLTSVVAIIEGLVSALYILSLSSSILFKNWSLFVYHTFNSLCTLFTIFTLVLALAIGLVLAADACEPPPIFCSRSSSLLGPLHWPSFSEALLPGPSFPSAVEG